MPLSRDNIAAVVTNFGRAQEKAARTGRSYQDELASLYGTYHDSFARSREMQMRYADVFPSSKTGEELEKIFENELRFEETLDFAGQSSSEDRLSASDFATLYHLLVNGALDRILKRDLEEEGVELDQIPASELLKLKVELAVSFIERVRVKNRESLLEQNTNPITVGMEVELDEPIIDFLNSYHRTLRKVADMLNVGTWGLTLEQVPDDYTNTEKGRAIRKLKKMTAFFGDQIPTPSFLQELKGSLRAPALKVMAEMTPAPFVKGSEGVGQPELQTSPSYSYRTQIRELLYASLAGGMDSKWNVHETIGGIELGPDIMDVLLMSAAAQYVPQDIFEKFIQQQKKRKLKRGGEGDMEFEEFEVADMVPKWSVVRGQSRKYPFHKSRDMSELEQDLVRHGKGVEIRGLLEYSIDEFNLLVRHLAFTEIASWVIAAYQKSESQRNENEAHLASLWEQLQDEWKKILVEYDIPILQNLEYYFSESEVRRTGESSGKYNQVLSEIILSSQVADSDFPVQVRTLIREFKKEARKYIPGLERKSSKEKTKSSSKQRRKRQ